MDIKDVPQHESKKLNRLNNTFPQRERELARAKARSGTFDWKKYESSNQRLRIRMDTKNLPKHESKKLNRFNNTSLYRELGLGT